MKVHANLSYYNPFFYLPQRSKTYWVGMAILGAASAFSCFILYVTYQAHLLNQKSSNSPQPDLEPDLVREAKIRKLETLVKKYLAPNQYLGDTKGEGDCLNEALFKVVRSLQLDSSDPKDLKEFDSLCQKHQFNLRIISVVCNENAIVTDPLYQQHVEARMQFLLNVSNLTPFRPTKPHKSDLYSRIYTLNTELIRTRLEELYSDDQFYTHTDTIFPKDKKFPLSCTLAFYDGRYHPVLTSLSYNFCRGYNGFNFFDKFFLKDFFSF